MTRSIHSRRFRPCLEALEDRNLLSAGGLDVRFGDDGVTLTNIANYTNDIVRVLPLTDGSLLAVGRSVEIDDNGFSTSHIGLAKYDNLGDLDASFQDNGTFLVPNPTSSPLTPLAAFLDSADTFVVLSEGDFNTGVVLQRFNLDGSRVTTGFGAGGVVTLSRQLLGDAGIFFVTDMVPHRGGIVVAGWGEEATELLRLDAHGNLDTTFGTDGVARTNNTALAPIVARIIVQPDDKIVTVGNVQRGDANFSTDFGLVRFHANGTLDTDFGQQSIVQTRVAGVSAQINAITIKDDNSLVVAGTTLLQANPELFQVVVAQYRADGSLDPDFADGGVIVVDASNGTLSEFASDVEIDGDGNIVLGATSDDSAHGQFMAVLRVTAAGVLDTDFGTNGETIIYPFGINDGVFNNVADIVVDATGNLIVAGGAQNPFFGDDGFGIARVNSRADFTTATLELTAGNAVTPPDGELEFTVSVVRQRGGPPPTGQVTFYVDRQADGSANFELTNDLDDNGRATLTISAETLDLSAGLHVITAVYVGAGGDPADPSLSNGVQVFVDPSAQPAARLFDELRVVPSQQQGSLRAGLLAAVNGTVMVRTGDTATVIVTTSSPAIPPIVTMRLGLFSREGVQQITLPNSNQPELATEFVYTLEISDSTRLGPADVTVNGVDLEGKPVQALNTRFEVVAGDGNGVPVYPISLQFSPAGTSQLLPGSTTVVVPPDIKNPGLLTIRPSPQSAVVNHEVLIYAIGKLPPNLILVNRQGQVATSSKGTAGSGTGQALLTAQFRPVESQAGHFYPVRFGCLDLQTGVSTDFLYTFQVAGAHDPQANVVLRSSTLSVPRPPAGKVQPITFDVEVLGLTQTTHPFFRIRNPGEARLFTVDFPEASFTPSGTGYKVSFGFTHASPLGVYEFAASARTSSGDYESNHILVYLGGPQATLKGLQEQLQEAAPPLPAVQLQLTGDASQFPPEGEEVSIFDAIGNSIKGVLRKVGQALRLVDPDTNEPVNTGGSSVIAAAPGRLLQIDANSNVVGAGAASSLPKATQLLITNSNNQIIAAGAGNSLVAPGAGNTLVAPGAGNTLVAPGAGNTLVAPGAGNTLVAPGAGNTLRDTVQGGKNLADRNGAGLIGAADGIVAAGAGGSLIAPGAAGQLAASNVAALSQALGRPGLPSLKLAAVESGPTQPTVDATPSGAALDAELYAHFQLWHAELLNTDGVASTDAAYTNRVSAAADALGAAATVLDLGFAGLSPEQLDALRRASTYVRLNVEPATPGGIIAPGSAIILTPQNPDDLLATGSATAATGTLPVALAGTVVTFGGNYATPAQPDLATPLIQLFGQGLALDSVTPNQVVARLPFYAEVGNPQLVLLTTADGRLAIGQVVLQPSAGDLEFSASSYTVSQGEGSATITINRTGGSAGVIIYQFAASDGTAVDGEDYTSQGGFILFGDGDTTPKTVSVPVVNHGPGAPTTTVQLTLLTPLNIQTTQPTKTALLTLEAANPGLTVTPLETPATAVGGGSFSFTVRLESPPSADVTIPLSTSNPSAAWVSVSALTFTPSNWQTPQTVVVSGGATAGDYTVSVGAATSSDADYDGRSAALPATNLPSLVKGVGTFTDSDGDRYTVKLKGPGRVSVLQNDAGRTLFVSGTTAKSKLSIGVTRGATGDGLVQVDRIQVLSALGKFKAPGVDLVGANVNVNGSLGAVTLHAVRAGSTIAVGGNVTSFTATVFADSFLYVGFTPTNPSDPLTGTFAAGNFKLGSFKVSGLVAPAFVNSVVAAADVGTVTLTSALTDNAAHDHRAFGVVGHAIKKVRIGKPAFAFDRNHPATELDDFEVRIV